MHAPRPKLIGLYRNSIIFEIDILFNNAVIGYLPLLLWQGKASENVRSRAC